MFMLWLYRYITGYVKFLGTGVFPERFLNLCAKDGVNVLNPKLSFGKLEGYMRVRDYKNIRENAKKSGMRFRVKRKMGLGFVVHRYRRRYGIAVGAALFFFIITFFSGVCMNITINGNEKIEERVILEALKEQGVYIGRRISDIDAEAARHDFLLENPEFSWAALNIRGSFVTVELRETTERQMADTADYPCNIVARRGGRILRIMAYEGSISVNVGERVRRGDLLVSGVIGLQNGGTRFVSAHAQVIAKTRRTLEVFVPFDQTITIKDHRPSRRTVVNIAGVRIPLFFGEVREPYIRKREERIFEIDGIRLPFSKTTSTFTRTTEQEITVSVETAKRIAREQMEEKAKETLPEVILRAEEGVFSRCDRGVTLRQTFVCEEDIARRKKILR